MKHIVSSFVLLSLVVLGGCGKGDGCVSVTGEVRHKGELLAEATVVFSAADGSDESASGTTDESGKFVLSTPTGKFGSGAKPGAYKVAITKKDFIWDGVSYIDRGYGDKVKDGKSVEVLPREYGNSMQTPLNATVTKNAKENVFNFDIP